ncbi:MULTISPECIES: hypothetical protein [Virgibacillus]|uniref:Uncharacterized protein n=1 Tax=Virgibacillus massiliensis TaxID=1462526 RepID=A0A024QDU1_9BACI|nr:MULTISPECIES: hypothetical protein [Virgibacillus]CDQ40365.1 hypothetical protein BN990_02687 [Virgibacillus massiliensis]
MPIRKEKATDYKQTKNVTKQAFKYAPYSKKKNISWFMIYVNPMNILLI